MGAMEVFRLETTYHSDQPIPYNLQPHPHANLSIYLCITHTHNTHKLFYYMHFNIAPAHITYIHASYVSHTVCVLFIMV